MTEEVNNNGSGPGMIVPQEPLARNLEGMIIRAREIDQVLFLGETSIQLMEFRHLFPSTGSPGHSNIISGEPFAPLGILRKEKNTLMVEDWRIMRNTVHIKGKRTLIVFAELDSIDSNRSFIDTIMENLHAQLNATNHRLKYREKEVTMLAQFMKEHHLETTWQEWVQDKLELMRVAQMKTMSRSEAPPVSVEVGEHKEKRKD